MVQVRRQSDNRLPALVLVVLVLPFYLNDFSNIFISELGQVKLGDFGQVVPGVALVAFFCLTFVIVATNAHLDREEIWERIAEAPVEKVQRHSDAGGMWSCGVCELLVEPAGATALAALLSGAYVPDDGERVAVLLCGGNAGRDPLGHP